MRDAAGWLLAIAVATPLATFLAIACLALIGPWLTERRASGLKAAALGVSFLTSLLGTAAWHWSGAEHYLLHFGKLYLVGAHGLEIILDVDGLTWTLMLLTTLTAGVIGRFSTRYLLREPGHLRFVVTLLLAEGAMLLMFAAGNLDLLFAGWELLGATSSMFICFYWQRFDPVWSGLRSFAVYKLCDVAFLTAILLTHHVVGTVTFDHFAEAVQGAVTPGWATVIALLLVVAVMGKSAQFPLSGWLPRAMEGPTPTSSIFYGALSIHAGAFLLLRCEPLLNAAPVARVTLILVALVTAVLGTMSGRVQTEAKGILAYASMVQTSLILVEIGLGWTTLAVFHLVGHSLVRTLQFLRAPSALHDFHMLDSAAGGHDESHSSILDLLLPAPVHRWLYRAALERSFLDTALERWVMKPGTGLATLLDGLESRLAGRAPAIEARLGRHPGWSGAALALSLLLAGGAALISRGVELGQASASATVLLLAQAVGVTLLVAWATPRAQRSARLAAAAVCLLAGTAIIAQGPNLATVALGHVLASVPMLWSWGALDEPGGALIRLSAAVSALLVAAGAALWGAAPRTGALALGVGLAVREGLFPFHSWLPVFARSAPLPFVAIVLSTHAGGLVLLRLLASPGLTLPAGLLPALCVLSTVTALYAALAALAERRLRATTGWISLGVSVVSLAGITSGTLDGIAGGLVLWFSKMFSVTGLLLTVGMVESRLGNRPLVGFSGLAHRAPLLACAFLVFALATVSIPGTLGFIAEDSLHKGLVEVHALVLAVIVFAIGLHAVVLVRVFSLVFLGPAVPPAQDMDLLLRERFPLTCFVLALVAAGLWPGPLVQVMTRWVQAPAAGVHAPATRPPG